jgi:hypothetical protein
MKKILPIILVLLLLFPLVSALDLRVILLEKKGIIIKELDNNATFKISIENQENVLDSFEIYSFVGVSIYPKESFQIDAGEIRELEIIIDPHVTTTKENSGLFAFQYQIKGQNTGFFKDFFSIEILEVKDVLEVSSKNIALDDSQATLIIKNLKDYNFEDLKVTAKSDFFNFEKVFDLNSKQSQEFEIPLEKKEDLEAGIYNLFVTYELNGQKSEETEEIKFLEKGGISISEKSEGFIIRKTTFEKKNEGNIQTTTKISARKNILTRLFTTFSEKPQTSQRAGLFVDYSWEKELGVGESFRIETNTNYTFPFILIILVIFVAIVTKYLMSQKIVIKKRVSLVKTKGGEFALKVRLKIKAKKPVSSVLLTDSLPRMAKLYEKYGAKPDHIDHKNRRISWEIKRLNSGEQRVFTYIVYSKINPIGSFELPSASASYDLNGMKEHSFSNKTSFSTETVE